MKKLIYILFLLPFFAICQTTTGQEQEFDYGIKNNAPQTVTSSSFITTTGSDGTQGKILGENISLSVVPPVHHFTPTASSIKGYFQGVDDAIGNLPATTAGTTTRLWYTADPVTITAGTFFKTNFTGKGTVSSAIQSVINDDNQKKYFTQDLIGDAYVTTTTFPKGVYVANLSVSTSPNSANQQFTIEVYKCNTNGTPIASGVTGAVTGHLGVTVIGILDSGLLTLADASITNVPLSTTIDYAFTINVGERVRYHISAAKVGTTASNITESVYYGTSYNSYIDIPVPLTTSTIQNSSNVSGLSATDALNNLNANKAELKTITQIRASTGTLPNTNFYTTDLGQEGNWYYDASDVVSADNTGTILVTSDGKRIKRIVTGIFNVKWFGAKGDGTTNDTPFIQSTINYVYDNNGGTVFFPNGKYRLNSALVTSGTNIGNPNSQLYFKYNKSTTANFIGIKLIGESPPSQIAGVLGTYNLNTGGVILYSDITGSGTRPAIIGCDGAAADGNFNYFELYIENIEFRVKANIGASGPTMGAINGINMTNLTVNSVFCGIDVSTNLSVFPTAETFGVYCPRTNGGGAMLYHVSVTGYKYGFIFSEHVVGDQLFSVGCERAFVVANGYHPNNLARIASSWCKYPLSAGISSTNPLTFPSANISIDQLDIEWQNTSYGNWFDSSFVIDDSTNKLLGRIEYDMIERNVGRNNAGFSKNGGANIQAVPLGVNFLPLSGGATVTGSTAFNAGITRPAITTGTASTPAYEDMYVYGNTNTLAKIRGGNSNNDNFSTYLKFTVNGTASNTPYDALILNTDGSPIFPKLAGTGDRAVGVDSTGKAIVLGAQPKKYTALISQTGTSAPTAIVLENTLGGTVVWTRTGTGIYVGTLSGSFTSNKTAFFITFSGSPTLVIGRGRYLTNNTVEIDTSSTAGYIDGAMNPMNLEIRVYP